MVRGLLWLSLLLPAFRETGLKFSNLKTSIARNFWSNNRGQFFLPYVEMNKYCSLVTYQNWITFLTTTHPPVRRNRAFGGSWFRVITGSRWKKEGFYFERHVTYFRSFRGWNSISMMFRFSAVIRVFLAGVKFQVWKKTQIALNSTLWARRGLLIPFLDFYVFSCFRN